MTIKKDYSYGVIPVIKEDGYWKVFILNQISYRSKTDIYWTFPKGHPESGETKEQTALRELQEEAGIVLEHIDTTCTFDQIYTFSHQGQKIEKCVSYYLGYAKNKEFTIQPEEVKEGKWCSFSEAKEQLSHGIAKKLLDEVQNHLTILGKW
jgi:8-oxo-dGTP pyrophosphatase MutT (NUDIX family)